MQIYRDTDAASEYLRQRGIKRTPATLRKLRSTGGGPKYRKLNNKPYYTDQDLDAWIDERLSAPIGSTSEQPAKPPRAAIPAGPSA